VQDGEIMSAYDTGPDSEYDLTCVLPTMEVLERAQQSASDTA
jgi:hypothetical protein